MTIQGEIIQGPLYQLSQSTAIPQNSAEHFVLECFAVPSPWVIFFGNAVQIRTPKTTWSSQKHQFLRIDASPLDRIHVCRNHRHPSHFKEIPSGNVWENAGASVKWMAVFLKKCSRISDQEQVRLFNGLWNSEGPMPQLRQVNLQEVLNDLNGPVTAKNVLLVKIKGPVWHTIYHHLPIVKGGYYTPLLINQPMGKGHLWWQQACRCRCQWHTLMVSPGVSQDSGTRKEITIHGLMSENKRTSSATKKWWKTFKNIWSIRRERERERENPWMREWQSIEMKRIIQGCPAERKFKSNTTYGLKSN